MNHKTKSFILSILFLLTACTTPAAEAIPTLTPEQQLGQSVYNLRCAQCHALAPDTVVIGPSMIGIATRASSRIEGYDAEAYIEESILYPKNYIVENFTDTMPTNFGKELTSDELNGLISYLMTLK